MNISEMPTWQVLCGDARAKLAELEENSVQMFITSVPYFGLRAYLDHPDEIGREETLAAWLDNLRDVFRAARGPLHPSGTLWINCGDTYASRGGEYWQGSQGSTSKVWHTSPENCPDGGRVSRNQDFRHWHIKPKDLLGLPWRLAFALQEDGWYLRSRITWAKGVDWLDAELEAQENIRQALGEVRAEARNSLFGLSSRLERVLLRAEKAVDRLLMSGAVMPESVEDRPTTASEELFVFSPLDQYFYDHHAIKVPQSPHTHSRGSGHTPKEVKHGAFIRANESFHEANRRHILPQGRNARNVWLTPVWRIPTESHGAFILSDGREVSHYASYPQTLAERAIRAGTSEYGCCATCHSPFERMVCPMPKYAQHLGQDWADYEQDAIEGRGHSVSGQRPVKRGKGMTAEYVTVGWTPTCRCYGEPAKHKVKCEKCAGTGVEHKRKRGGEDWRDGANNHKPQLAHDGPEFAKPEPTGLPCPACLCPDCKGTGKVLTTAPRHDDCFPNVDQRESEKRGVIGNIGQNSMMETDESCPTCDGKGATGHINGDVWPKEILDAWPRVPCTVGDMFAGSGQAGRAALALDRSSVQIDLSPHYCELMQERMAAFPGDIEEVRFRKRKKEGSADREDSDQLSLFAMKEDESEVDDRRV